MKKSQRKGYIYEKRQAKKHGGKHLGGPRKPDYVRGKTKGEVKNWSRPVHSGIIIIASGKGIKEITSKSGFTGPAIELAKKKKIKLIHRNKPVS
jgi:hypothetical protein